MDFRPISISLSPNTEKDDIQLAFKLLFRPGNWKISTNQHKTADQELEEEFKKYLRVSYAFSFNSGRSAFLAILNSLEIKENDEVLLQAFTCNAAVNPILNLKAKPIFVDIDDTLNLDPEDLKKKITSRSKAILVQHTFGWPAQIQEISKIAKENDLFLIEDCAHALGASILQTQFTWRKVGTLGDAAFFSFGRDKIISSVFGGMAVTGDEVIAQKIGKFQERLSYPSNFWLFQQLLHPILTHALVLPAYGLDATFGTIVLGGLHKLSILSKAVYKEEKKGEFCRHFPRRLPDALSYLALNQFRKLERFNKHRKEIANFYQNKLTKLQSTFHGDSSKQENSKLILPLAKSQQGRTPVFMRYPILTKFDTDEILKAARKRKIYLDDGWRASPIVPLDTDIDKMQYQRGSCPRAEKVAQNIVNLPTHINVNLEDAQKIVNFLKSILQ